MKSSVSLLFSLLDFILSSITVCALVSLIGCGSGSVGSVTATVQEVKGIVQVKTSDDAPWEEAKSGIVIRGGGALKTGEDGRISLETSDRDTLTFDANTYFELLVRDGVGMLSNGRAQFNVRPKDQSEFKIQTPHALTAVLGTVFTMRVQAEATDVALFEGKILVRNNRTGSETRMERGHWAHVSGMDIDLKSFTIPAGSPIDFELPSAQTDSTGEKPGKTEAGVGSGTTTSANERENHIDLNETEPSDTNGSGSSSLDEILRKSN